MCNCSVCSKEFKNERALSSHLKIHKPGYKKPSFKGRIPKIRCHHCKKLISKSNIKKHEKTCFENPQNYKECLICNRHIPKDQKFCSSSCSATYNNTHRERNGWSDEAKLKHSERMKGVVKTPSGSCKLFEHTCKICNKFRLVNYKENQRKTCSRECQTIASTSIRPYQNGSRKTTWYYNKHQNKEVLLESSWEVQTAKLLDKMNIGWIRPPHIKWVDKSGKERLYFPDFYLPKTDIYLDPKNPYCMEQDKEKLEIVTKNIDLIYGDIEYIKEYILSEQQDLNLR